jgi:hypothetical protein
MITRRGFITSGAALMSAHAIPNARALAGTLKVLVEPYVAWCVGSEGKRFLIYTWAVTKAETICEWNRLSRTFTAHLNLMAT